MITTGTRTTCGARWIVCGVVAFIALFPLASTTVKSEFVTDSWHFWPPRSFLNGMHRFLISRNGGMLTALVAFFTLSSFRKMCRVRSYSSLSAPFQNPLRIFPQLFVRVDSCTKICVARRLTPEWLTLRCYPTPTNATCAGELNPTPCRGRMQDFLTQRFFYYFLKQIGLSANSIVLVTRAVPKLRAAKFLRKK